MTAYQKSLFLNDYVGRAILNELKGNHAGTTL